MSDHLAWRNIFFLWCQRLISHLRLFLVRSPVNPTANPYWTSCSRVETQKSCPKFRIAAHNGFHLTIWWHTGVPYPRWGQPEPLRNTRFSYASFNRRFFVVTGHFNRNADAPTWLTVSTHKVGTWLRHPGLKPDYEDERKSMRFGGKPTKWQFF